MFYPIIYDYWIQKGEFQPKHKKHNNVTNRKALFYVKN